MLVNALYKYTIYLLLPVAQSYSISKHACFSQLVNSEFGRKLQKRWEHAWAQLGGNEEVSSFEHCSLLLSQNKNILFSYEESKCSGNSQTITTTFCPALYDYLFSMIWGLLIISENHFRAMVGQFYIIYE